MLGLNEPYHFFVNKWECKGKNYQSYTIQYIDGLVREKWNSIANALELRLSRTNPSISYKSHIRAYEIDHCLNFALTFSDGCYVKGMHASQNMNFGSASSLLNFPISFLSLCYYHHVITLTHKHSCIDNWKNVCIISIVASDVLILKHQAISIHNADGSVFNM